MWHCPLGGGDVLKKKMWQKLDDSRISSVCTHLAVKVEVFDSCSAFLNTGVVSADVL